MEEDYENESFDDKSKSKVTDQQDSSAINFHPPEMTTFEK